MFPFLSVLCALLGVFMLFILVVTGSWVDGLSQEAEHKDDLESLQQQLAARQRDCRRLKKQRERFLDLLVSREDLARLGDLAEPTRRDGHLIGVPKALRYIPDPSRTFDKEPLMLEIRSGELTAHPGGQSFSVDELNTPRSPLLRFLAEVDLRRDRQYLLLLLRPNGFSAYEALRGHLRRHFPPDANSRTDSRIDVGVEPYPFDRILFDADSQPAG